MKKLFYPLIITALMFISGCGDSLYQVYNDFTGPVESVDIPGTKSIVVDTSEKVDVSVYPSMTENKNVTWESADELIASVDADGVVTAHLKGGEYLSTIITVTTEEGGFAAQCVVTVVPVPIPIESISLPAAFTVGKGLTGTLTRVITPSNATNSDLVWTSDNPGVATVTGDVDGSGIVSGVNNGTATIKVTSVHWNKSASCVVTVGEPSYTVTYKKNDGTTDEVVSSTQYKTGEDFTVYPVNTFTRDHYTFTGWKTGPDGTGSSYDAGADYTMGSSSIILYAQWSKILYTVTYVCSDSTSGTVPAVASYGYGDTVTVKSFSETNGGLVRIENPGVSSSKAYYCTWLDGSTERAENSTFLMPGSNVTLSVKWNVYTATYNAIPLKGPAGGLVVYDKNSYSDGWRYLELAPASSIIELAWGVAGSTYASQINTPATLGKGPDNTVYLKGQGSPAALYCDSLSIAGYTDWFLPSIDEMTAMLITNYSWNKVDNVPGDRYWSSSSDTDDNNHAQDYIYYGSLSPFAPYIAQDLRDWAQKVRAVRRF